MTNRILIVDDEPKNIDVLHNSLREADFKVMIAKSGDSAIKRIAHTRPDLILLDINMPGIDGYETCRRLKNIELSKDTPVIFITAETETIDKVRGLEIGAVDYITKPFQPEEVVARVERHLTIRNLQKQVDEQNVQLQQEIAERKQIEEELRQAKETALEAQREAEAANQTKSTFLANMSHELRSPLNAIIGFARVLDRGPAIPPDDKEHLAIIRGSGEHLLNLINDVLDMSKIEAGCTVLSEQNFDVYRLLDDVEAMFRLHAEDKGLHLIFECDAGVPLYIRTDEIKLRQVLVNLLSNALKFTKEGGIQLSVTSEQLSEQPEALNTDNCILFTVEDTGPGIAPDDVDSVFEAFVQIDSGRQSQEGTGLGLPISRKFVRMMGGDMTVESEVGKGSVFSFWIQAEAAEGAETETAQPERRVIGLESDQPRYRILIADDRESNRLLLLNVLKLPCADTGHPPDGLYPLELREAAHGKEALDICQEWKPHLIFMDMRMPVMDGYEATNRIKGMPRGRATVIIAVTAGTLEEERAAALSAGCDDFVSKPFVESRIFDMIHRHLGVSFVYESPSPTEVAGAPDQEPDTLTVAALAALPPDWVADLEQALLNIDLDRTADLIERISARAPLLAETIKKYMDDFEYERILTLIQKAASQNGVHTAHIVK